MYTTAANWLGHAKYKNTDWFQECDEEIQSLLATEGSHAIPGMWLAIKIKMAFLLVKAKALEKIGNIKNILWPNVP